MPFNLAVVGTQTTLCGDKLGNLILEVAKNFVIYLGMVIACNGLRFLLKPYKLPRITSDIMVGLTVGNIGIVRRLFQKFNLTFGFIIDFGMMCYMFALGIEMDPRVLLARPAKYTKVAVSGVICTFIVAGLMAPMLQFFPGEHRVLGFTLSLATMLTNTDSPVLTRLMTQLKIGKSDIGKLMIGAAVHSDFLCYLILSIGYIILPLPQYCNQFQEMMDFKPKPRESIKMGCAVLVQVVFTSMVSPMLMKWVSNENPEGRPMKGPHLVLSLAFMVLMCAFTTLYDYSPMLSAFLVGLCVPREGRVSKWVITRINYMLTSIFFPIFFLWMGYEANFRMFDVRHPLTWVRFVSLLIVATAGKVAGTIIAGAMLGFRWPESVAIGLLLVTKGHLHIYLAIKVIGCGAASVSTGIVMVMATFLTALPAPAIVANIIRRAKKRAPTHRLAIQLLDPSSEMRILLCVQGPQNVPASINLVEITRGTADAGIVVYVTDMIELTDELSDSLERDEGLHATTLKDKEVMDMREQVTKSFQDYVMENDDGITLKRTMALSTITTMPADICILAEDLMIALVILPFHRSQREDGKFDAGNSGFRYVNRKVLRSAPCSVGILVDRGFGSLEQISKCEVELNVAVIFIGGKDDREALAYASRVAQHPKVKLTVLRFLVDTSIESSTLYRIILPEQENEMKSDDECFTQFYERHVLGGRISYMEKHLANASETFSTLKSFEGQYSLVIVGREGGMNSILTLGMNDWQQCPELGPIGDVLSGSDFSATISVLIIQQHRLKGEIDGLDEDFSII
ncbi:cation/H(+) antiporter 28 [Cajanus cajan]|uniref:K(+)/H(+) antiporter 13 n=1 Tax=Cajanus cajan TaxID=3821 RepID=A0A151TWC8_CAJCA|nr:cation/H(+) antiporter 28 [Cajanus cajan]KYP71389.1 K(+)/H(+) antiporter 13 [Cajanus cajan]